MEGKTRGRKQQGLLRSTENSDGEGQGGVQGGQNWVSANKTFLSFFFDEEFAFSRKKSTWANIKDNFQTKHLLVFHNGKIQLGKIKKKEETNKKIKKD